MVQLVNEVGAEQHNANIEAKKMKKKEKKRLKKLALEQAALAAQAEAKAENVQKIMKKDKKKKKKEKPKNSSPADSGLESCSPAQSEDEKKAEKKAKKREAKRKLKEAAEAAQEEEQPAKKKQKKQPEQEAPEEEPAKKKKKNKDKKNKKKKTEQQNTASGIFKKCFYTPTETTNELPESHVKAFLGEHNANVSGTGSESFKPVLAFADAGLDDRCTKSCKGFQKPTPIQSLCWPIVASGRDIVGIAETGSGKTLAFCVPGLAHMVHRKETQSPEGVSRSPMMLVVAPTRELAMQSQEVMEKAGKTCGIRSVCLYGGVPKHDQRSALHSGVEVVVATPGRLLDFINEGECDVSGVSYLVLDEADRMLDQGFERDIRAIIAQTHPDRQTCLFSATWPECIRQLAGEFLKDPIKVTIGSEDLAAGKKVTQIVEVVEERSREFKLHKLLEKYHCRTRKNRILIFVLYKKEADRILNGLQRKGWTCAGIHGDRSQEARTQAVESFKRGSVPILVATDVAARGLDIPGVEYVINYSFPLTIEDYVHRIGRTGRAGKSGIAHTFFHSGDKLRAGELVKVLKDSNQTVPEAMNQFDLNIKRKEHKLYGNFGPKDYQQGPLKTAKKIKFDD